MKFIDIINDYYEYSFMNLKETTFKENRRKIELHILPYFKNKNIYDISIKDIILWKDHIIKKNYSYNYNSYLYYCLNNIFEYLYKIYDIKNYAKIEGNFKNKTNNTLGNYWSIDDFKNFIKVIPDQKDKVMFELLFYTGLRKSELLALTFNDISTNFNTININKSITREHKITSTKNISSNRIISITNDMIKKIMQFKTNDFDFVFNISFTTLKRKKDYYCKIANVKKIKIHEFRHSHAIFLFQNNIPIDEIQQRLGHSNMSTTSDIYLKYLPRNEKRVIQLLNSQT